MTHNPAMGHDEALQTIVSMAAQGLIAFTNHALEKMPALGLIEDDVRHCLTHPTGIEKSDPYHHQSDWMVRGSDLSGNSLTVCVVIEADVLVVTVF